MSLRYWNSVGERARLDRLIYISEYAVMLECNKDDDDSSVVSWMSLDSFDSFESFDSDGSVDSFASDVSEESDDLVDMIVEGTIEYAKFVYQPIIDEDIDFEAPPLRIADLDESKCISDFRFRKQELQEIADRLWPKLGMLLDGDKESIKCSYKYQCPYETGLLLTLFRLSRPRRIRPEIEKYFGMRKSKVSAVVATFINAIYELAIPYFSNPSIFQHRFPFYAQLIQNKSRLGGLGVWGFIDGTLRKTCRPSYFQRLAYSGHKRCHGIKFQSVVTPDGLIALLFGPIAGCRHDSFMLAQSGLLPQLNALMPLGTQRFSLFGDPAYPQSLLLFGGFRGAQPGSPEAQWNTRMSKVREVVEWLFKEIITLWSFLDFKASMKIFQFPVAKYFMVAAFLTNLHTVCYSSQTCSHFGCKEPEDGRLTLAQYIALVP